MGRRRIRGALGAAGACVALVLLTGCGGAPASGPAAAPPAATAPSAGSADTPTSSATGAPYPAPQEETFQGCPPAGDGGDAALNLRKNRVDTGAWRNTPLQSLLGLTWPTGVEQTARDAWSPADTTTVANDEGRPVTTEGYVLAVRHEGAESPNCHDPAERDYHVWLGAAPSTDPASRASSLIVELAPRVVARNPGWGGETTILRLAGRHVRVSGWLLLDQEHPEQVRRTRGTLWEIHPVLTIAVEQGGTWIDLASGRVALGGASIERRPAANGQTRSGYHPSPYGGAPRYRPFHRPRRRRTYHRRREHP